MKEYGITYFKQIIQSQKAYESGFFNDKLLTPAEIIFDPSSDKVAMARYSETQSIITAMSKGNHGILPCEKYAKSAKDFSDQILDGLMKSTAEPKSCFLEIEMGITSAHALSIIENSQDNNLMLFDPNFGIMKFKKSESREMINYIWDRYRVLRGLALPFL